MVSLMYPLLRAWGLSKPTSMRIGMLTAGVPLALLVLQSIGQLTIKDVFALLAFLAVAYFYMSRTMTSF